MYCSHFRLNRLPFNNTPDPAFYFSTPDHEEALATLQYATLQRKGFVLVTGEVGAGKTLIGRMFLRQVDVNASTAVISHTHLDGQQLLVSICRELGVEVSSEANNLELIHKLQDYLLEEYARDRYVVVLVDEAQNLPDESFEELRMLGNLEADDAKLLQVCILGQPELRDRFRQQNLKQFDQRLFRRFHLPSLSVSQTGDYIRHRMEVAGCTNENFFTPQAIEKIFAASQGTPRIINQICDNALLTAYGQDAETIDETIIEQVLEHENFPEQFVPEREEEDEEREQENTATDQSAWSGDTGTQTKIAAIYGQQPTMTETVTVDPLIDESESSRLAELVRHEHEILNERIQQLTETGTARQEDVQAIVARQNELQKIVGGATARWLAAKERIEAYRNELHTAISGVVSQCDRTQDRLEQLSMRLPADGNLNEYQRDSQQKIEQTLDQLNRQREEFQSLFQQAESRWTQINSRLESLSGETVTDEELSAARREQERALKDIYACTERLSHLINAHDEEIQALEAHLAGQLDYAVSELRKLQDKTPDANELKQIREQYAQIVNEVLNRVGEQGQAVEELRLALSEQYAVGDEQNRALVEELTCRVEGQAGYLRKLRAELIDQQSGIISRIEELAAEAVGREELETRTRALHEELNRIGNWAADREQVEQQHQALNEQIDRVRQEAAQRSELISSTEMIQRQLQNLENNAAEREEVVSIKNQLDEDIHQLRESTVDREEFETTRAQLDQRVGQLRETMAARAELDARTEQLQAEIQMLRDNSVDRETMESTRQQLQEAMAARKELQARALELRAEILELRERSAGKDELREQGEKLHQEIQEVRDNSAAREEFEAARRLLDEQIHQLRETAAGRDELEQVRQAQQHQAGEIGRRIAEYRQAMQDLIEQAMQRCQDTQQQLDTLATAAVDQEAMAEHCAEQQREYAELIETMRQRREETQLQFERLQNRWSQTQEQVELLASAVEQSDLLEQVQKQQEQNTAEVMAALDRQREGLQSLIEHVGERCEKTQAQVDSLPDELVTGKQLREISSEHNREIENLFREISAGHERMDQAFADIENRCAQTEAAIQDLAARTASSEEVENLREEQRRNLEHLLNRIEQTNSEQARQYDHLHQRYENLSDNVEKLAKTTTPAETFKAVNRSICHSVQALGKQVGNISDRQEQDLRTLIEKIQATVTRLEMVEKREIPQPISVNVRPEAGLELAAMIDTARHERGLIEGEMKQAAEVSSRLSQSTAQVCQVMDQWRTQADEVQGKSEQLRDSAQVATEVLKAMQKCSRSIDEKLKSPRWQNELQRGEDLAARLERAAHEAQNVFRKLNGALNAFSECEAQSVAWQEQRNQAVETTGRLEKLLKAAQVTSNKLDTSLNNRNRLIKAIAQNTAGLADVIRQAQVDSDVEPMHLAPSRNGRGRSANKPVEPIHWPMAK